MVIQRWQSVFLLLGAILAVCINFGSWANIDGQIINLCSNTIALTINILVAVLFIIAIFMFRNMRRQKTVTLLGTVLLTINNISAICLTYMGDPAGTLCWYGGPLMFVAALVAGCMAYNRISADERLLRSADRLR